LPFHEREKVLGEDVRVASDHAVDGAVEGVGEGEEEIGEAIGAVNAGPLGPADSLSRDKERKAG